MALKDDLYHILQYREYDKAGMVPHVTCDDCEVPYMPRVIFDEVGDDDVIEFYCYQCGYNMTPGGWIINEMTKYVQQIEE